MIRTSMQAAVYQGPRQLVLSEQPVHLPGSGEVLIQVAACGVCGTDIHIFQGEQGAAECPPGTVLGHEFSGTIAAVGANVGTLKVGDRVAVDPNDACGFCDPCRQGKNHFCLNMIGIGTTTHGGFAEYCTIRAKQAWKLPDGLSFAAAALAEPVACCLHGLDRARLQAGQHVLIIGGGTIGMIMLQLARLGGAARVTLAEPRETKRRIALQLGADQVIDPEKHDVLQVLTQAGLPAVDLAIEAAGLAGTVRQAIDAPARGGTALLFGLTEPECQVAIKPFDLFARELTILGSYVNPYTMGRAVTLLSQGRLQVESLIGNHVELRDIGIVFEDADLRSQGKVLVGPS